LSGRTGIADLHRETVDDIVIPSQPGAIPRSAACCEFDCWFESGSMSFSHCHYPFEHSDSFDAGTDGRFPADFIAEGLDQTRGWFYTLLAPYENVIVNGLVLAADGSKSKRNYPGRSAVFARGTSWRARSGWAVRQSQTTATVRTFTPTPRVACSATRIQIQHELLAAAAGSHYFSRMKRTASSCRTHIVS